MAFLYGWKATGQADDLAWTPADYQMRIALSQIGPLRIELIEAKKGESIYADFIKEHGYGVHHFGILVEDMRDALTQIDSVGLNMIQDGSGSGLTEMGIMRILRQRNHWV